MPISKQQILLGASGRAILTPDKKLMLTPQSLLVNFTGVNKADGCFSSSITAPTFLRCLGLNGTDLVIPGISSNVSTGLGELPCAYYSMFDAESDSFADWGGFSICTMAVIGSLSGAAASCVDITGTVLTQAFFPHGTNIVAIIDHASDAIKIVAYQYMLRSDELSYGILVFFYGEIPLCDIESTYPTLTVANQLDAANAGTVFDIPIYTSLLRPLADLEVDSLTTPATIAAGGGNAAVTLQCVPGTSPDAAAPCTTCSNPRCVATFTVAVDPATGEAVGDVVQETLTCTSASVGQPLNQWIRYDDGSDDGYCHYRQYVEGGSCDEDGECSWPDTPTAPSHPSDCNTEDCDETTTVQVNEVMLSSAAPNCYGSDGQSIKGQGGGIVYGWTNTETGSVIDLPEAIGTANVYEGEDCSGTPVDLGDVTYINSQMIVSDAVDAHGAGYLDLPAGEWQKRDVEIKTYASSSTIGLFSFRVFRGPVLGRISFCCGFAETMTGNDDNGQDVDGTLDYPAYNSGELSMNFNCKRAA